jgi:hypothetical protein
MTTLDNAFAPEISCLRSLALVRDNTAHEGKRIAEIGVDSLARELRRGDDLALALRWVESLRTTLGTAAAAELDAIRAGVESRLGS